MFKFEFPSERDLEDYIWHELVHSNTCPIAGEEVSFAYRQMGIPGYGITDIVKVAVFNHRTDITILELKNETLKESHLSQLARYMRGVERWASRYERFFPKHQVCITGELAGPVNPGSNDLVFLASRMDDIAVYDIGVSMESGFHSGMVGDGWFKRAEDLAGGKGVAKAVFDCWAKQQSARDSFESLDFPIGEVQQ